MPVRFLARTSSEPASLTSCNSFPIRRLAGLVLATALLLTGCGGGGSSGGGGSTPLPAFSVSTSTSGSGTGSIFPSSANVIQGNTVSFQITPSSGYGIGAVTGCGGSLIGTTYTTGPITAACQVSASFIAETVSFLAQLEGDYKGQIRSPKNISFVESIFLSVDIDGNTADITKGDFFRRSCQMNGELAGESYPVTGNGTFRCSDFSEGSWTAPKIVKLDDTTILATFALDDGVEPYRIRIAGFGSTVPALYNPDQDYWLTDAPLADFSGAYDGQMTSADSCSGFFSESYGAQLSVLVDGDNVQMVRDSLLYGICEFSGTRDSFTDGVMQASGTFRCSNFDEGTWTSERIVLADPDVLFANLRVNVPARACRYTVRHIVFKRIALSE